MRSQPASLYSRRGAFWIRAIPLLLIFFAALASGQGDVPAPLQEIQASFDAERVARTVATTPTTHVVSNSSQLFAALQEAPQRDLGILFQDNINLTDSIWDNAPTFVIPPGRTVVLKAPLTTLPDITSSLDAITAAGGKILNFSNRTEVIRVEPNGTLAAEGLYLTGSPPVVRYLAQPLKLTRPQPYGLATFPSVLCDPGCQVVHNYTVADYYDLNGDCSKDALQNIALRAAIALGNASDAGIVKGADAVYLLGQGTFTFPVLDPSQGNATVGSAFVLVNTTVRNCLLEGPPTKEVAAADSDGLPAWAWVLIGLAILATVAASLLAAAYIYRERRRRKHRSDVEGASWSVGELPPGSRPPVLGVPLGHLSTQNTADKTASGLLPVSSMYNDTLDVAAAAAMDIDVAALIKLRDAWRTRIGRVHGLDFLEVVGRGGFGTVYRATWRGSQVAVKLVEHSVDSTMTKEIQREAALATSCSHPNIVITYKVATAGLGDLEKLSHYVEVNAAAAEEERQNSYAGTEGGTGGGGGDTTSEVGGEPSSSAASSSNMGKSKGKSSAGTSTGILHHSSDQSMSKSTSSSRVGGNTESARELRVEVVTGGGSGLGTEEEIEAPLVPSDLVATLIVMEFCDLGCLRRALHIVHAYTLPDGARDLIALLRTLVDVALGLDYLHNAAGVVHGDLKPANVLLTTAGNTKRGWIAKLADFGVARAVEEGMAQQPSTVTARAEGGTNAFMSPEVVTSGRLIPASDVYAFGILMWEGWTGLIPFSDQENSGRMLVFRTATLGERPPVDGPSVAGMPSTYKDLMQACWAADSDFRPEMPDVVDALRALLGSAVEAVPGSIADANNKRFLGLLRASTG